MCAPGATGLCGVWHLELVSSHGSAAAIWGAVRGTDNSDISALLARAESVAPRPPPLGRPPEGAARCRGRGIPVRGHPVRRHRQDDHVGGFDPGRLAGEQDQLAAGRWRRDHLDMNETPAAARLRHAVRAVILADDDSVLLCRFSFPHPAVPMGASVVWAAPAAASSPVSCRWRHCAGNCTRRQGSSSTPTRPTSGTRRSPLRPGGRLRRSGQRLLPRPYHALRSPADAVRRRPRGRAHQRHAVVAARRHRRIPRKRPVLTRHIATPLAALIAGDIPGRPVVLGL